MAKKKTPIQILEKQGWEFKSGYSIADLSYKSPRMDDFEFLCFEDETGWITEEYIRKQETDYLTFEVRKIMLISFGKILAEELERFKNKLLTEKNPEIPFAFYGTLGIIKKIR